MSKHYRSNPIILAEARAYIDGLILSDGYIQCNNDKTARYIQLCKYKNWLDVISRRFYEYGVECKIDNGHFKSGGFYRDGGSVIYLFQTGRYIEFKEMRDRWYRRWYDIDNYSKHYWHLDKESGEYFIWKKVVPKDICLSSECVANWYLGDGSLTRIKYHNQLVLSTNCLLVQDIVFLSDLLSKILDIKCHTDKAGRVVISNISGINTFLNYIKDYEVMCYSYKFSKR